LRSLESPEDKNAMLNPLNNEENFTKRSAEVTISFIEIYNENVNDLLFSSKKNLEVREDLDGDVFVENLTTVVVTSEKQFLECM
jgi:hypothetical protein